MKYIIKVILILIIVCFIGYIYFQPTEINIVKRNKAIAVSEVKINPIEKRFPIVEDELLYILNKHKKATSCLIGSKTVKGKDSISIRGRYILKDKKGLFLLENIYEQFDVIRNSEMKAFSAYYHFNYSKEVEIDNYDYLFPFNNIIDNLKNDSGIYIWRDIHDGTHLITVQDNISNNRFELSINNLNFNVTYISIKFRTLAEMESYYKDWVF